MICRHCGFQNAPNDEFCGNCGKYLEWDAGTEAGQAGEGVSDDTQVTPLPPLPPPPLSAVPPPPTTPPPAYPPPPPAGPPQMARPVQPPVYGAVACWNCGQNNPPNRAFCQNCGERLSVSSLPSERAAMARPDGDGSRLGLIVGIGLVGVVLLAAIAAAMFLGGGPGPTASPTGGAGVSPSPEPSPTLVTDSPTDQPTEPPSLPPTAPPVTVPPTAPPPTPVNCANSTVPTAWVNLDGANRRARVRRGETWCIHQVWVVPDPNFGVGRIRLRIGGDTLVDVTHAETSTETEYPFLFPSPILVPPRTNVDYSMNCGGGLCNAVIQVGYDLLATP